MKMKNKNKNKNKNNMRGIRGYESKNVCNLFFLITDLYV